MIETGQPKRAFYEERQIKLSMFARATLLQAVFDRYQLRWMTQPLSWVSLTD